MYLTSPLIPSPRTAGILTPVTATLIENPEKKDKH
jgi:hypothetical protein